MTTIELQVSKSKVMTEVAETTSYVGQKMPVSGENPIDYYDRIFTTDEDRQMLERFWVEACDAATSALRHDIIITRPQTVSHGCDLTKDYEIILGLPVGFNDSLVGTMNTVLFSYFVNSILGKWFMITNKEEAAAYSTAAEGQLADVVNMTYQRRRPMR